MFDDCYIEKRDQSICENLKRLSKKKEILD